MNLWRHLPPALPVGAVVLMFAPPAAAHGFGQRYDLPIPLSCYLWAAGATVALSFAILAVFLKAERAAQQLPTVAMPLSPGIAAMVRLLVGTLSIIVLLAVIAAGFLGDQNPMRNVAPVMIWIIGWVGLSFLSAVLGPVWRILNPWAAIFRCFEWAFDLIRGPDQSERKPLLPASLGVWPAFVLFLVFAWMGARMEWAQRAGRPRRGAGHLFRRDLDRHGVVRP